jgi:hypothetical protein
MVLTDADKVRVEKTDRCGSDFKTAGNGCLPKRRARGSYDICLSRSDAASKLGRAMQKDILKLPTSSLPGVHDPGRLRDTTGIRSPTRSTCWAAKSE